MHKPKVAILVLAAGNSSRLGQPKQLLKWKSSNLLQHAIDTMTSVQSEAIVLVLGANFEEIFSEINTNTMHVVNNKTWQKGLGNSIAVGVKYIENTFPDTEAILIALADQPLITKSYLLQMISEFEKGKQQILATKYKENVFGVPAIFDKTFFGELQCLNDDEGAKQIIKKYHKKMFALAFKNKLNDIDTLNDYKRIYKANHQ